MPAGGELPAAERKKPEPNYKREILITRISLALTLAMTAGLTWGLGSNLLGFVDRGETLAILSHALFVSIIGFLLYGSFVYQLTRLGYLQRRAEHRPATDDELGRIYHTAAGELAVLVPSYKEEPEVVRRTLISAAVQDHPHRRVMLLIDDPVAPKDPADARALRIMRELPVKLQKLFDAAAMPFDLAHREYLRRHALGRD